MFSRAGRFKITGGTFNINTHQPANAYNQPNSFPSATCASEIIACLDSIERRIADFGVQAQETRDASEADHKDYLSFRNAPSLYPFQMQTTIINNESVVKRRHRRLDVAQPLAVNVIDTRTDFPSTEDLNRSPRNVQTKAQSERPSRPPRRRSRLIRLTNRQICAAQ